jgi:hypothetical protein
MRAISFSDGDNSFCGDRRCRHRHKPTRRWETRVHRAASRTIQSFRTSLRFDLDVFEPSITVLMSNVAFSATGSAKCSPL